MGMTYEADQGQVVLFGGFDLTSVLADTWNWDGTNWTQQHPATSPPAREGLSMTDDAARSQVVMFGGGFSDTWTWDGMTWTEKHPATSPSARFDIGLAYDAAKAKAVLFGGVSRDGFVADTWTWDGTHWRVPLVAHLHLSPKSGPPGTVVQVTGDGFAAVEKVTITFVDSVAGKTVLGKFNTDPSGNLAAQVTIPANATVGTQKVRGAGKVSHQKAKAKFTVT
jgi:hypothetical protein